MRTIGDRNVFAFEYDLLNKEDNYVFANFCFWINGKRVGDYETETTISVSISYLNDFLKNYAYREYDESHQLQKEDIFFELYDQFFQNASPIFNEDKMGQFCEYYWLDEVGEQAFRDYIGIILINEPKVHRQRFLWKEFETGIVFEEFIPMNYFDLCSKDFIHIVLKDISEKLT